MAYLYHVTLKINNTQMIIFYNLINNLRYTHLHSNKAEKAHRCSRSVYTTEPRNASLLGCFRALPHYILSIGENQDIVARYSVTLDALSDRCDREKKK